MQQSLRLDGVHAIGPALTLAGQRSWLSPGLILVNGLLSPFLAMRMVAECLRGAISVHLVPVLVQFTS